MMVVARSLIEQRSDWWCTMWSWGVWNQGAPITVRYLLEFFHQFYCVIPYFVASTRLRLGS